jgi:hypothetical protein
VEPSSAHRVCGSRTTQRTRRSSSSMTQGLFSRLRTRCSWKSASVVSGDRVGVFKLDAPAGSLRKTRTRSARPPLRQWSWEPRLRRTRLRLVTFAWRVEGCSPTLHGQEVLSVVYRPTRQRLVSLMVTTHGFLISMQRRRAYRSTTRSSTLLTYLSSFGFARYGILPFEIEGTITSAGLSQAAIKDTDSIVS